MTDEEAQRLWADLRETGSVQIAKIDPWGYVLLLAAADPLKMPAGMHAAWFVARDHNISRLKNQKALYQHLSGAAMTIWLSRNWTTKEILSKIKDIEPLKPVSRPIP